MIQENTTEYPEDRMEVFLEFLELLLESHLNETKNEGNVLVKMTHFWEYFMNAFEDGQRYFRMVKKANSIEEYRGAINQIAGLEAYL
jgi:tRNA-dihydrouridine synthase